jgi:4-amino-4-deoxy-L-arabinose transferase-like glycosyltransferase
MFATCSSAAALRLFGPMDHVLADKQGPGLIPRAESNLPESLGSQDAEAKQDRRELPWGHWEVLMVLLLTTILYFSRLGARALWASEFRWAEIAREMLLTHNYFWPTINGHVYFDKPLGSYWLILASAWITGRMDEVTARIPGAMAGVLAVALLILLTYWLYDLRTGVAAGLILATSFGFAFWARTVSADIETIAGELAVLVIFMNNETRIGWWVIAMWFLMAVTSLMKGLLGFVLPIMVISVYSCIGEGWLEFRLHLLHGPLGRRISWLIEQNRWFFNWRTVFAVMLAIVVYFAPFAISYADTGSAKGMYMVYRENIERYFAPFDHRGPIYLYTYVIFGLMAPWSVFLPAALIYAHGSTEGPRIRLKSDRFVLAFFWTTFVFFTVSGSRRSYYILPILPAASILVARIFMIAERNLTEFCRFLLKVGFGSVFSVLVLSLLALLPPRVLLPQPYAFLPSLPARGIFLTCWIVSLSIIIAAFIRYSRIRMMLSVSLLSYLLLSYLFMFAMPAGDQWRSEKRFADTTRRLIGENSAYLASFKTQPPVFYLGFTKPVPEYNTLAELESAIQSGRIKWVILRQRDVSILDMRAYEAAFEPNYPWDSQGHRLNSLVLIKLER